MEHLTEQELNFLRKAIDLARQARQDGRHPFGALIVNERGETVVAARNNAVRPAGDPTQHAEMVACAEAARLLGEAELARCTLYTSTEPCAMCAGAIYWTGVGRVVFALRKPVSCTIPAPTSKTPPSTCPAAKSSPADKNQSSSMAHSSTTKPARYTRALDSIGRTENCAQ
jgi:tRNA(Arg) A34 adenosine deaminase TadA